jgi:ribosomal protein L37AE/L43A
MLGIMLVGFIPLFIIVFLFNNRWFKGVFGEFIVNHFILKKLPETEYTNIKNITLPTENGTTQVDHIVVSKFGIFVIETKNMKGWIFGSTHKKQWVQKIYKHSSTFQNPLHQNYKHVKTVESALGSDPKFILHSVIVFVGDSTFKTDMPNNVTHGLGCIHYIRQFTETIFSDDEVQQIIETLNGIKLKRGLVTNIQHRKHVKEIVAKKENKKMCPQCGSEMVIRVTKQGSNAGQQFLGCSTFPKCRKRLSILVPIDK